MVHMTLYHHELTAHHLKNPLRIKQEDTDSDGSWRERPSLVRHLPLGHNLS